MRALTRLYLSGMTREGVASAIEQSSHSVRLYERGLRFPTRKSYAALVNLAEERGLLLLARDFIEDNEET